jgi:hypothetical protein
MDALCAANVEHVRSLAAPGPTVRASYDPAEVRLAGNAGRFLPRLFCAQLISLYALATYTERSGILARSSTFAVTQGADRGSSREYFTFRNYASNISTRAVSAPAARPISG